MVDTVETLGGALDDIRAFCAVIELGTISAAARLLKETKGGVSRRLSRLERHLGVALLARTPRAVTPTGEGTAFFARAREGLSLLDDAAEGARRSQRAPGGHLRVTAPVDFGVDVLPEIVVRFRNLYPQITVELMLTEIALDLAAHRVDLALRATSRELPDMGYRAVRLAPLTLGLYAAPAYISGHGHPANPQELLSHDAVLPGFMLAARALDLVGPAKQIERIACRPAVSATDFAALHRLTIAGAGIAPLPDLVARRSIAEGQLLPVLPGWSLPPASLYAISLGSQVQPQRVRFFREFCRRELARMKRDPGL